MKWTLYPRRLKPRRYCRMAHVAPPWRGTLAIMPLRRIVSLGVAMPACGWAAYGRPVRKIRMNITTLPSSPCTEKVGCLSQAIGEAHLGTPTENAPSVRVVHTAAELLAWLARVMFWREVFA